MCVSATPAWSLMTQGMVLRLQDSEMIQEECIYIELSLVPNPEDTHAVC